jgi:hypothetical protein
MMVAPAAASFSRSGRCLRRAGRGQSVVEVAIVLPVLLFIALGAVDVGRVIVDYIGLRAAAMDGAIYGARNLPATSSTADIADWKSRTSQRVKDHVYPNPWPAAVPIAADLDPTPCIGLKDPPQDGFVTVTITKEFTPISLTALQFVSKQMDWTFTIKPTAKVRCMT